MTQHYTDPTREGEPHALPDLDVFEIVDGYRDGIPYTLPHEPGERAYGLVSGWYWQACFPGCLPDGDVNGPFNSEQEALQDARDF